MVKFFRGNGQVFISKKQKDLAVKSIPFVLKSYAKMSLLDNQYELPWLESRYLTTKRFLEKIFYLRTKPPSNHRFIFWDKMVKFFGGNGQVFI